MYSVHNEQFYIEHVYNYKVYYTIVYIGVLGRYIGLLGRYSVHCTIHVHKVNIKETNWNKPKNLGKSGKGKISGEK